MHVLISHNDTAILGMHMATEKHNNNALTMCSYNECTSSSFAVSPLLLTPPLPSALSSPFLFCFLFTAFHFHHHLFELKLRPHSQVIAGIHPMVVQQ